MMIKSQCGDAIFNSDYLVGMWIDTYAEKTFMLKAIFGKKEVVLGVYDSKEKVQSTFNTLSGMLKSKNTETEKCIKRLADLIRDRKSFITGDIEFDSVFLSDIHYLEKAIDILKYFQP